MAELFSPRVSPRPASCNDLEDLPQKSSPRSNELTSSMKTITLPPMVDSRQKITSSSSCNDLDKLSPRFGTSTRRNSSVTCGWLPRVEDEPIELVNEDNVMIATVVELMMELEELEKRKKKQTLLPPLDYVSTLIPSLPISAATPPKVEKEELQNQNEPPILEVFDLTNALDMMTMLGNYDGEDTSMTLEDLDYLLQFDKYEDEEEETKVDHASTSMSYGNDGVKRPTTALTSALTSVQGVEKEVSDLRRSPISILENDV